LFWLGFFILGSFKMKLHYRKEEIYELLGRNCKSDK
jgi:hypothetical protein